MTSFKPTLRGDVIPLVRLGLPLVGSSIIGFSIHMTDTIMLGWYNVTALAASTLASSWWFILYVLGAGFGYAVVPMVAAAIAGGDDVRARRVTRMAFWLVALFWVLMIPLLWWSGTVFHWMGQTDLIATEAQKYLRIAVIGLLPALLAVVMRSYLSAQHRTGVVLVVTAGALVPNACVNYLLIFGTFGFPEMGLRGAAIASVLVEFMAFSLLALYAQITGPEVHLFQRIWRADWEAFWQVFRLGVPIGMTSLAESGLFSASAVMMGWIGTIELAAHGIALQLAALTFMVHLGMSQAATIRAGGAYGRKDETELRRIALAAISISLTFGVIVVALFLTFPAQLVSLFIDPSEPAKADLLRIGMSLLAVAALFQIVDAGQVSAISLLRGVQDTNVPMWLASVSYWVIGLPVSYVFAFVFGWGAEGLWLGLVVGLACACVSLMYRFWTRGVRIGG